MAKKHDNGYTDYPEMKDIFRLAEQPDGKYNLEFNNNEIVYQNKTDGGTKYRLFFRIYDSSRDAQGNVVGWGRNKKGFERLSIDVEVFNGPR